ncbi:MAG: integrase family protein [Firmicutes bacterium]|nr:integrase family protein [Bacillota bacterium]
MTKKKRPNGEGGITYDEIRNSYRASVTTPVGKRLFKRCKTEEEAIKWKTEQLRNMHTGMFIAPSDMTVGEWAVQWLATYKKDTVKQRTYERYTSLAKHLAMIAGVKLQDLTPLQVQQFYQTFPHLSACTVAKVHKILKDMFNKAFELEMIRKNIMTAVKPPKFESKPIETFTREEIDAILNACKSDSILKKYYPTVLLATTTGMRLGEVLGVQWRDINFVDSTIHIRRSLQLSNVLGLILESPKTRASIRKIKITDECKEELKKLRLKVINMDIKQETLCFVTKNDTPIAPRNFERVWKSLLGEKHANIPYRNFHVLRHTHATELLAAGTPLSDVAKRLGHSKQSHTLELYSHAMPNHDDFIADTIQKLYAVNGH